MSLRDGEVTTDDAHGLGAKIPSTVDPTSADILSTSPSQTTGSVSNPSTMVLSPECVRPYPKALPRKNTQNRSKKMKSTVITDMPEKDALMEKRLAKKKINKKKKIITSKNIKKLAQSSSESSDSDFSLRESDDSDGSTYNLPPSSKASSSKASTAKAKGKRKRRKTQKKKNNNKTDDYCIVCKGSYLCSSVDWLVCAICKKWAHETCGLKGTNNYFCHNCN